VRKVKAAVIGVGYFGELHARGYAENPLADLVAVVDSDARRAVEVASRYGVKGYTSYDEMLEREEIDAVSIATPDDQHAGPAVSCARAGKDILLEKPMAPSLEEADRILSEVRRAGVKLMINFILRFDPRYVRAREEVSQGSVGDILTMWARRVSQLEAAKKYGRFSDLLRNVVIHDIDQMNWLTGSKAQRVYGERVRKVCSEFGTDDAYMALVRYENGAVGMLETSWVLPSSHPRFLDARLHIIGSNGGIYIDQNTDGILISDQQGFRAPDLSYWPVSGGLLEGDLRAAIHHFLTCVADDRHPIVGGDDGRKALEIALAIKESCISGQPVSLLL